MTAVERDATIAAVIDWERLARGAMHPTQIAILQLLALSQPASPSQLSDALDEPLGNVSYHVRYLLQRDLLLLTHTRPRRGAVEHFYVLATGIITRGSR